MVAYKVEDNKVTCILIDRRHGRTHKYYGVATCSPEDSFDLEKGKKIAFLRARLMELGENDVKDSKLWNHIEAYFNSLRAKFDKRRDNIAQTRSRLRAELQQAYEA